MSGAQTDAAGEGNPNRGHRSGESTAAVLSWTLLVGLLVAVALEALLWALTRVFVLNFDIAGPNATLGLVALLSTGWSLAVVARIDPAEGPLYAACTVALVVGLAGSLASGPLLAGLGAVLLVTAATPPLAGLAAGLEERVVFGVATGIGLFVGLRVWLVTASPYATATGTALFGAVVLAAAGGLVALAVRGGLPATEWDAVGPAAGPLLVLLLVGAGYLAVPWTVARWALRPYWLSVGALVAGVLVGAAVVVRGAPSGRETVAWAGLFLSTVAALLFGSHPLTAVALAGAWAGALALLAAAAARTDRGATPISLGVLTGLQLLAVLSLLLATAATHWAYMPAPLDRTRGLTAAALLAVHAVFVLAVGLSLRSRAPATPASTVASRRRSLLTSIPAALLPVATVAGTRIESDEVGPRNGSRLRVMTLNLHAFFAGGSRAGYNLTGARELIEGQNPDIVALAESDGLRPSVGHVDGLRWLGAKLGYHTAFGGATRRRSYGVGLLSRWPIDDVEVIELPVERSITRLAVVATVRTPDGPLPVVSAHLSVGEGNGDARRAQVETVIERATRFDRAVVMGDFNVAPDDSEYEPLSAAFTDAWLAAAETEGAAETHSASDPRDRIDYVFLRGAWTVHEAATAGSSRVSDHKAVVAEIQRSEQNST